MAENIDDDENIKQNEDDGHYRSISASPGFAQQERLSNDKPGGELFTRGTGLRALIFVIIELRSLRHFILFVEEIKDAKTL